MNQRIMLIGNEEEAELRNWLNRRFSNFHEMLTSLKTEIQTLLCEYSHLKEYFETHNCGAEISKKKG